MGKTIYEFISGGKVLLAGKSNAVVCAGCAYDLKPETMAFRIEGDDENVWICMECFDEMIKARNKHSGTVVTEDVNNDRKNMAGEDWVENIVFAYKGEVNLHYSYHSSGWVATWQSKNKLKMVSSVDENGEGKSTIDGALEVLKERWMKYHES